MFKKDNDTCSRAANALQTDNRNIRVVQFLDAYERQEGLWNPNSENYKNKLARYEAYLKIIEDLNMPNLSVNEVKLKIKSIRTSYKKELRVLNKYREGGKNYCPKLFWFSRADSFLKDVSISRNKSVIKKKMQEEETEPFVLNFVKTTKIADINESADQTDETEEECSGRCGSEINVQSQNSLHLLDCKTHGEAPLSVKLPITRNDSKAPSQLHEHIMTALPSSSDNDFRTLNDAIPECNHIVSDDEYDMFCRSVAVQLRGIRDNYSRSVAKLKIQQILFEAETGHYRNTACVTIPVSQNLATL